MEGIKDTVEALQKLLLARMTAFEEELKKKISPGSSDLTIGTLAQEYKLFQTFAMSAFSNLQNQMSVLSSECDNLETRSRRKMLLLHGVPEVKNENSVQVAVDTVSKRGMPGLNEEDIRRAHRLGRTSSSKPRPLVIKFCSLDLRDQVWFAKTKLKGSGVTMSEFLTRRRHNLFMECRERLGVAKCWTSQGRVVVLGGDGKRHTVHSSAELERVLEVSVAATKVRREPASGTSTLPATVEGLAARRKRAPTLRK